MILPKRSTNLEPEVVWEPIPGSSQELAIDTRCHHTLYHGARGPGKDVANDTPVLTDSGWKRADEVTYDDKLVALDGSFTRILGIYPKKDRPMWRVEFYTGDVVYADSEHRWLVLNQKTGYREGWKVRTTEQLASYSVPFSVPYMEGPMDGPAWDGPDPYWIGYMIANGTTRSSRLCAYTIDDEALEYAESLGWYRWEGEQTARRAVCPEGLSAPWRAVIPDRKGDEKHVPEALLWADPASRLALLQGLMDGDGNVESGAKSRYTTVSRRLADEVAHLAKSLGGWATVAKKYDDSGYGTRGWRYVVNISHHNKFNPFRLTRKASEYKPQRTKLTRGIKSVTYSHRGDGVCFAVEHKDHCFVIDNWIVTHNTITQLMRFRRRVGLGYGSFWRGVIFDREFKHLADLVAQSKRFFLQFGDGASFHSSGSDYKWVWPTGEELLFRHIKKVGEYDGYHGHEYPFLGWNELTKYPTVELYEKMMSVNRSSFLPERHTPKDEKGRYKTPNGKPLPNIPLEVFSTTNPNGPGHNWVKRKFIDVAKPGEVVRTAVKVFNPRTQQDEEVVKTQVAIFGSFRENIYLPPEYIAELESITDPNLRKAWLYGDWSVVSGGIFDDLWSPRIHVLPRFTIPKEWPIDRSFDWGSTHPFSVGWWAEANGEEVTLPNGQIFAPAPGSLIQIADWYGTDEIGTNKGLRLSGPDIAKGIIEREIELMREGWISTQPYPGPADNQIRDVRESDTDTIEKKMLAEGIRWSVSDKSPGSRKNGVQLFRDRLTAAARGEGPGIYFMVNCQGSIQLIPTLPRDEKNPDDVDTDAEDHPWDMVRYRLLNKAKRIARNIVVNFPR